MKVVAADLFAGAGGASTGLMLASNAACLDLDLVAVNHWPAAVNTHAANHPAARHMCEAIERVDPREAVPGGKLHLLVAGPECTFFSTARGGRPIDDQRRSSAWSILRWLELLRVEHVLIENVPEFQAWAPLDSRGRPMKSRRGEVYRAFLAAIEAMNYRVEARILNAADFGEATTRKRLFIQAARGRRAITWPEPTHSRRGGAALLRLTRPWRPAREVIDWTLPSASIFGRKKPLSKNTLRRIEAGLRRFGGQPFTLGQQSGSVARSTNDPLPTIAADGAISCIEPFLVEYHSERHGEVPRVRGVDEPLPTLSTENRFGLAEPFVVSLTGTEDSHIGASAQGVEEPLRTLRAGGTHHGLVQPFVVQVTHGERERPVDFPLPTITGGQRGDLALIEPFLSSYYGNGSNVPVSQPVPTITARDRFALVIPDNMDIRFRMLQPHELAEAMGFPKGYRFIGNKGDTIRMIGNAWSCRVAEALCACILERWSGRKPGDWREEASA